MRKLKVVSTKGQPGRVVFLSLLVGDTLATNEGTRLRGLISSVSKMPNQFIIDGNSIWRDWTMGSDTQRDPIAEKEDELAKLDRELRSKNPAHLRAIMYRQAIVRNELRELRAKHKAQRRLLN